ncbi:protein Red-like [Halichondria panicea]|uniref:protein Red-like n=1 Tax=Halichondria panicea TaxID=6063 RepID=UPI00312B40DB
MPEGAHESNDGSRAHLTNDDFRRLLMTPKPQASADSAEKPPKRQPVDRTPDTRKAKKKSFHAKVTREEDEWEAALSKKYRDRAKERRSGDNPDYKGKEDALSISDITTYKSVAPNIVDPSFAVEARNKAIQESKFLGGDLQHTHLVKGLDFLLLDKVRQEHVTREQEQEEMMLLEKKREKERARRAEHEDLKVHTTLGKNIYRTLFLTKVPEKNELFAPRRMAYVYDLEDEYAQSDIPTTLMRSRADCPTQQATTLTTNDIVINKLTQILSYLRQGSKAGKKGKKRDKGRFQAPSVPVPVKLGPEANLSIFGDIGDYKPDLKLKAKSGSKSESSKYFNKQSDDKAPGSSSAVDMVNSINTKYGSMSEIEPSYLKLPSAAPPLAESEPLPTETEEEPPTKSESVSGLRGLAMDSHYSECYPGGLGDYDANYDSDDDADFSKMDLGNKKGPVKRWDFDNEEDYGDYQSKREALPKAAFQYGVKMNEGRKTRRYGGGPGEKKNKEKAKLDREWQKISAILDKRQGGSGGGSSAAKKQKMNN